MRKCTWRLRWRLAIFASALAGNAFGGVTAPGALVVAQGAGCRVGLTKVSYDTPGADDAEFLELHVETVAPAWSVELQETGAPPDAGMDGSTDAGVLTLGDCGLAEIELVDGGSGKCESYRSIPLAGTPVPSDGYVELCAEGSELDLRGACDVTHAGRSALKDGWLQNGPSDGLRFTTTTQSSPVEVSYEGRPACFSFAARALATETGELDGGIGAPEDDVNVFCSNAFVLLPASEAPLRQDGKCPLPRSLDAGDGSPALVDAGVGASAPWTEERAPMTSSSGGGSGWFESGAFDAGLIAVPKRATVTPKPPGCVIAAPSVFPARRSGVALSGLAVIAARLLRRRKRRTLVRAAA